MTKRCHPVVSNVSAFAATSNKITNPVMHSHLYIHYGVQCGFYFADILCLDRELDHGGCGC